MSKHLGKDLWLKVDRKSLVRYTFIHRRKLREVAHMETRWIAFVFLIIMSNPAISEGERSAFDERYPQRTGQISAAENGDVSLRFFDKGGMSATAMNGIPLELRSVVLYDEQGLRPFLDGLGSYYGFMGREGLIVDDSVKSKDSTVYSVNQTIDGLTTDVWIRIYVDNESYRAIRIDGVLYSVYAIDDEYTLSEETAHALVRDFVRSGAYKDPALPCSSLGRETLDPGAELATEILYKKFGSKNELRRWWGIGVPVIDSESARQKDDLYDWFWVDPLGVVSYWVYGRC